MPRLLALLLLVTGACEGMKAPPPVEVCTKIGEQCRLPQQGPLGVCNSVSCQPGQAPPCLRCAPQH